MKPLPVTATVIAAVLILYRAFKAKARKRTLYIKPNKERVLIIGASSGLGRTLTKHYASRGARVCAVARRKKQLDEIAVECGDGCLAIVTDFTNSSDMVTLRHRLVSEWGGLDTVHICAGVGAVQPVMQLAGDSDEPGIEHAAEIAQRAVDVNFKGVLIATTALIPTLKETSLAPAILLVSSVAAIVPAPTRALYAATKAASLLFFQSLAIEQPTIAFTTVLPATIEGDFRASAIDADPNQKAETNKKGLKLDYVASVCTDAVDGQRRGNIVVPWVPYAIAHHLYYLWPSLIERQARKKYDYTA
ncbi:short chain dehydrogenase [Xylariaceae sp. FL1019]|nr:short chain dehydrogenase [Xylariaceae sp. FL1019]